MSTTPDNNALIYALYQGTMETTPWQTFLPLLRDRMDALAVSLILRPPAVNDPGVILNAARPNTAAGGDTTYTLADPGDWQPAAYREQFFAMDPFVNVPDNDVITLAELVPEAELLASEYYHQYLKPAGVFHILGADTRLPDGLKASLRVSRERQGPSFNKRDKALCAELLPHLRQAIAIHARLSRITSERELFARAVTRMAVGTILLDEHGQVLETDDIAAALIEQRDGLSLSGSQIHLTDRQQTRELQQMIEEVLRAQRNHETGVIRAGRIPRPSGRHELGVIIRPVPASEYSEGQASPAVALFISDPAHEVAISVTDIERLFGFTPAESSLAVLLSRGLSVAEAATELGISQHTARAQLKSIFSKAGVTRQAELVRLIVKSVASLA